MRANAKFDGATNNGMNTSAKRTEQTGFGGPGLKNQPIVCRVDRSPAEPSFGATHRRTE